MANKYYQKRFLNLTKLVHHLIVTTDMLAVHWFPDLAAKVQYSFSKRRNEVKDYLSFLDDLHRSDFPFYSIHPRERF